jgi:hypothetical protein
MTKNKNKKKKHVSFRELDQADVRERGIIRIWERMSPEEQKEKLEMLKKRQKNYTEEQKLTIKTIPQRDFILNSVYKQIKELDSEFYSKTTQTPKNLKRYLWVFVISQLNPVSFPELKSIEEKLSYKSPPLSLGELKKIYRIVRSKTMKVWFKNVEFTDYGWKEKGR